MKEDPGLNIGGLYDAFRNKDDFTPDKDAGSTGK
jgi:hypothetical protein